MLPDILGLERALPWLATALAGGYLLGSIPFGVLVARGFGLADLRRTGSGNIGATNVLRTGHRTAALLTLLLDLLKGLLAAGLAAEWGGLAAAAAGAGAALGHCWPVWLRFQGGKGVATSFGVLLAWDWLTALVALAAFLLAFAGLRIVSVASLVGAMAAPVVLALRDQWDLLPAAVLMSLLVLLRHRANLGRLFRGEEPRLRFPRSRGGD